MLCPQRVVGILGFITAASLTIASLTIRRLHALGARRKRQVSAPPWARLLHAWREHAGAGSLCWPTDVVSLGRLLPPRWCMLLVLQLGNFTFVPARFVVNLVCTPLV